MKQLGIVSLRETFVSFSKDWGLLCGDSVAAMGEKAFQRKPIRCRRFLKTNNIKYQKCSCNNLVKPFIPLIFFLHWYPLNPTINIFYSTKISTRPKTCLRAATLSGEINCEGDCIWDNSKIGILQLWRRDGSKCLQLIRRICVSLGRFSKGVPRWDYSISKILLLFNV